MSFFGKLKKFFEKDKSSEGKLKSRTKNSQDDVGSDVSASEVSDDSLGIVAGGVSRPQAPKVR